MVIKGSKLFFPVGVSIADKCKLELQHHHSVSQTSILANISNTLVELGAKFAAFAADQEEKAVAEVVESKQLTHKHLANLAKAAGGDKHREAILLVHHLDFSFLILFFLLRA